VGCIVSAGMSYVAGCMLGGSCVVLFFVAVGEALIISLLRSSGLGVLIVE